MAGASLAFELSRAARVCLIEAEERAGYHSTGRSAALFAPTYGNHTIRALTRASRAFFTAPPHHFCEFPLLQPRGVLFIARADQRASAAAMLKELKQASAEVCAMTREEALRRVPLLRESYLESAVYDHSAMDINVDGLHQGYLRGARAAGTRLVTNSSVSQVRRHEGRWSVELRDETVHAPVLVNAAGAWADQFASLCGVRPLGLQALRRTAALVDMPDSAGINAWPAVIDIDEQFYFKPEAGKLLISPADETPSEPCDVQPDEVDVAIGIERVEAALAIDVRRVTRSWSGLRTFSPDRSPVVGFDARVDGYFWCAGQGGYGIQTAPALSRAAAALLMHAELPANVRSEQIAEIHLSPKRF